ncbi:hypothetical protein ABZ783_22705 [Micromonospora sp. NPDC047738]|uniref:hypothetical protein n=1 Tax=Micromonospora sp. NPDC047738 TaxID=3155741 RepID=UPI0033C8CFD2
MYQNHVVEIYNRSSASVSLTGWSVQYASVAGRNFPHHLFEVLQVFVGEDRRLVLRDEIKWA